jgi:lipid II:glycine glycyltransferase (peptidoglycan interpeptide bridge formation enzyme)
MDNNEIVHAVGFFVFDKESVYYLVGGINPEFTESGGMNLYYMKP